MGLELLLHPELLTVAVQSTHYKWSSTEEQPEVEVWPLMTFTSLI